MLAGQAPVVRLFCLSSARHGVQHRGGLCSICCGNPLAGAALLAHHKAFLRVFTVVRVPTINFVHRRVLGNQEFKNCISRHVSACVQISFLLDCTSRNSMRHTSLYLYVVTVQGRPAPGIFKAFRLESPLLQLPLILHACKTYTCLQKQPTNRSVCTPPKGTPKTLIVLKQPSPFGMQLQLLQRRPIDDLI